MVEVLFSTALGQGQVFLLGQMVSASMPSYTEIARMKTQNSNISFKSEQKSNFSVRTVMYNNNSRLHLSSVANESNMRQLSAAITSGTIPSGTKLKLAVQNPNDNFHGYPGDMGNEIVLNNAAKVVVKEIGTCYSERGANDGYGLDYTFEISNNERKSTKNNTRITVTLTLTAVV